MKAAILNQPKDYSIQEIDMPVMKDDEVLIKVKAAGICTNDVRDFNGQCSYSYPRIGGHEYGGIIVDMGSAVDKKRFQVGQRVVKYIIENCGECHYCKHGEENICFAHQESNVFHNPNGISGYGGYGQYVTAKAKDLFIYPETTSFEKMAMTEPLACVCNSIDRTNIKLGDDVVVIGGGPMGLLHVMCAKLRGARVILSEPLAERRELALKLGCHDVIDPINCDAVKAVKELTGGRGGLYVFNTTAAPFLAAQAVEMTAPTGTVIMFSSIHPNEPIPVDMGRVHSHQVTITGAVSPTVSSFYEAVQLIAKNIIDVTPLIETTMDFTKYGEAIALASRPDTYKVILTFDDED